MGSHKHSPSPQRPAGAVLWTETACSCGKRAYVSRGDAKRMARNANGGNMRPYPCPEYPDSLWHVGHQPRAVRMGEVSADEYYGRGSAA